MSTKKPANKKKLLTKGTKHIISSSDNLGGKLRTPHNQGTNGTCYAFAIATAIRSALMRENKIFKYQKSIPSHKELRDLMIANFGKNGAPTLQVVPWIINCYKSKIALRYKEVDEHEARKALHNKGRAIILGFGLTKSEWKKFDAFFEKNPKGVLTKEVFGKAVSKGDLEGHAVCLIGYDKAKDSWKVKNSWGGKLADDGYYRIKYKSLPHREKILFIDIQSGAEYLMQCSKQEIIDEIRQTPLLGYIVCNLCGPPSPLKSAAGPVSIKTIESRSAVRDNNIFEEEQSVSSYKQDRADGNRFDSSFELPSTIKEEIIHEGWMSIQAKTKKWNMRWFELYQNNTLIYYEKTDEKKDEKGNISLYELSKIKTKKIGNGFKIELMANTKTVAHLRLEDKEEYITWRELLESRIDPKGIFEGFAEKQGSKKNNWQKRWLKLVSFDGMRAEMRYYEESKMSKIKKFRGLIDIANVAKVQMLIGEKAIDKYGKKRSKILEIVTSKRIHVLSFEVMNNCMKCKEAMEQSMSVLPKSGFNDDDDTKETENSITNHEIDHHVTPPPLNGNNNRGILPLNVFATETDDDDEETGSINGHDNVQLPPGWRELEDPNGTPYYHNEQTGVTQWDKPE